MQIETVGQYQLHLIAHELPAGGWDPFVSIFRFDAGKEDFECVVDKHHVDGHFDSYEAAIEAATRTGNKLIRESGPQH
ncbi:hypothetical protein [Noviherbaspirillum aridicola]|uniref:Uncharacterized protein n=1 Tax=Noviherbaspirillum aridicola TaxID=2849687 RepID=A0ABQ4Q9K0_9BURK|nr:hypothetical protein [Noviherbaspirillum aridicola]GIZ53888.1 hypothetical protein NCCP691_39020 [Noviherbaspirillum aridicola]